jgi:hypothetical protein
MMEKLMEKIAKEIAAEIKGREKPKRIKVRTLMKNFGFKKRTEESSQKITQLLADNGIYLNPSITKIGETWKLSIDDWVTLTNIKIVESAGARKIDAPAHFDDDKWFTNLKERVFRTEKEVEIKFIVPLLFRLGYTEDDRYDGMTFMALHGSKKTNLEADFALFDAGNEVLENQVLLVVEAKREERLIKEVELEKAQKQTKSYAIWLSCHYGLVTDSNKIQVLDLYPPTSQPIVADVDVKFECNKEELKDRFGELFGLIGKPTLVEYYEGLIG